MRISVVIAAYNAATLIGPTLATVFAQSRKPDEVIVVDDGSTDATAEVAAALGARVVSTPNRGVSAARNTGIAQASGDWIALLDADDLWLPEKLERQADALALAPEAVLVSCDHYQFRGDGEITRHSLFEERRTRYEAVDPQHLAPDVSLLHDMGVRLPELGMAFFPSTLLMRRDLALEVGGFDEAMRRCEDYEFVLRLLARGDVIVVESPLMGYRIHSASLSNNAEQMNLGLLAIADRLEAHPERYAPNAPAAFAPRARQAMIENAAFAIKRGDRAQARALLARAGAIRRGAKWWLMNAATRLPTSLLSGIAHLKRRVAG